MLIEFESKKKTSFEVKGVGGLANDRSKYSLESDTNSVELRIYYIEDGVGGIRIVSDKPEDQGFGTLRIRVELNDFVEGLSICLFDDCHFGPRLDLMNMPRTGSPASLFIETSPKRVVTVRDGIGDWTKSFTLSREEGGGA